jgi:hypothetical protein
MPNSLKIHQLVQKMKTADRQTGISASPLAYALIVYTEIKSTLIRKKVNISSQHADLNALR